MGLVLGIVGAWSRSARPAGSAQHCAVVGVVLSSLAVIGGILVAMVFAWAFSCRRDCLPYASQGVKGEVRSSASRTRLGSDSPNA
ncbi:hypothetical protein QJS66_23075 [Kocuria rhizophila]|nr:hypothetical protein QJS66_23075 [Kocuria rhizophila]